MCHFVDAESASEVCNATMKDCKLTGYAKRDAVRQKVHRYFWWVTQDDLYNERMVDTDDAVRPASVNK